MSSSDEDTNIPKGRGCSYKINMNTNAEVRGKNFPNFNASNPTKKVRTISTVGVVVIII